MSALTPVEVTEKVTKLIRRSLPTRGAGIALAPTLHLRSDLGIDSMGLMTLAFKLEQEFGIDVSAHTEQLSQFQTIGDVVSFICEVNS